MDPFLGLIALLPYSNFTPRGWMACEGQVLSIGEHQALYSLIGTQFGGNGYSTFALPDLRSKAPTHEMRYFIAIAGIYPSRS